MFQASDDPSNRPPPDVPRWRDATFLGLATGVSLVGAWSLTYGLRLTPYPPFDFSDLIIRVAPGWVATNAIEDLGAWAQRLLLAGGVVASVVFMTLLVIIGRKRVGAIGGLVAGLSVAVLALGLGYSLDTLVDTRSAVMATFLMLAIGGAVGLFAGRSLERLRDAERRLQTPGAVSWLDEPGDFQRRELLRWALIMVVVAGGGGSFIGWAARRLTGPAVPTRAGMPLADVRAELEAIERETGGTVDFSVAEPLPPFEDDFAAPAGVRPRLTSNDRFYVIDISTRDPNIPDENWSLTVGGLVERQLQLSYLDLLSMPAVELDGTLMCISYEYGTGLISTTRWTGVPLRHVLRAAGIGDRVKDIVLRGAGGYSDSIPLSIGLDPRTILAYGMNGTALPRKNGFPCRLYVPNIYGEKNVKWLESIELVDYDYQGFWQERGWTDEALINAISVIDTPFEQVQCDDAGIVPIGGIAFAGSRGVERVELRIDQDPWIDVELEPYEPELVWQRWRYDWSAPPGRHELTVRATEVGGIRQVEQEAPPHPDGMTGLHTLTVAVL